MRIFDSHLHIIEPGFPLFENQGYKPDFYTVEDYQKDMDAYQLNGGAVVSGSFQKFDQRYLINALQKLGPGFVGVTQIPHNTVDSELDKLHEAGVRAIRFNLKRGGSESIEHLAGLANRVYERYQWHTELYIDSKDLADLENTLRSLPKVSIDHFGLSKSGFEQVLRHLANGGWVKATGFSRIDFDPVWAAKKLLEVNPEHVVFGTDLPGTRAPKPFTHQDIELLREDLSAEQLENLLFRNAQLLYQLP